MHEGRMTMAQALLLDIPTPSELTDARDFLCEAAILVTDVKSLLSDSSHLAMAARLRDIQGRLADEIWAVERLIAPSPRRVHTIERSVTVLSCAAPQAGGSLPSVRTHAFFPSKGRNEADHGMLGTANNEASASALYKKAAAPR